MHRIRSGIAVMALAGALVGCGDSAVDEGPKEFKPTDTTSFQPMFNEMKEKMKDRNYTRKAVPPVSAKEGAKKEQGKEGAKKG